MIPYELDPSLHAAPPAPERFDDGFAPPPEPLPQRSAALPELAPPPGEPAGTAPGPSARRSPG